MPPTVVMDADRIGRTLTRIAHEIVERNKGVEDLALVGVRTRGVPIARRIARALKEITGDEIPTGALDITLYRDDLAEIGPAAVVRTTEIEFDVAGRYIILMDDVLYTGRSIRAALAAINDLGRPKAIRLAILVDRGGRELPIQPDFVGITTNSEAEHVTVRLVGSDGVDRVEASA